MLAAARDAVSADALDSYRQQSRAELWQVDSTHPPTALRVAMLRGTRPVEPMALLSDMEALCFDQEMTKLIAWRQREVVNRRLEAVYGA